MQHLVDATSLRSDIGTFVSLESHCMSHNHLHHHNTEDSDRIGFAFFLNLIFTIIEFFGGLWTNSVAIISDALHDLGDSVALGMAWYFQRLSHRKKDNVYSYGYRRFSLLGALINSIILIIGSVFIIREALLRIGNPEPTHVPGMIILAVLGILFNGAAVLKLKKGNSHNERVVTWHLLEDVLGWTAVLMGSIVIYFTGWYQIDPWLSIFIAAFILFNVYKNLKSTLKVVLQAVPDHIDLEKINNILKNIDDIIAIHDLHLWSLDGNRNILTVHVVVSREITKESLADINRKVHQEMHEVGIDHCTVEIEHADMPCALVDC